MTPAGDDEDRGGPAFGPSGYLPERASKRARKIVLRAPLGMQWVWAAIVAGAVVLIAGLLFLGRADDGPGAPYEAVAPVADVSNGELRTLDGRSVLFVTEGGRPRAFDVTGMTEVPVFCGASRRLETSGGVWTLTGRGLGVPSLESYPTLVSRGVLHVDLTAPEPGIPAGDTAEPPTCAT